MGKYSIEESTLTAIAEAIRAKAGSSDPIDATDMAALIGGISDGCFTAHGTFVLDTYSNSVDLGMALPGENFVFWLGGYDGLSKLGGNYPYYFLYTKLNGNEHAFAPSGTTSSNTSIPTLDQENGVFTHPVKYLKAGSNYFWIFAEVTT